MLVGVPHTHACIEVTVVHTEVTTACGCKLKENEKPCCTNLVCQVWSTSCLEDSSLPPWPSSASTLFQVARMHTTMPLCHQHTFSIQKLPMRESTAWNVSTVEALHLHWLGEIWWHTGKVGDVGKMRISERNVCTVNSIGSPCLDSSCPYSPYAQLLQWTLISSSTATGPTISDEGCLGVRLTDRCFSHWCVKLGTDTDLLLHFDTAEDVNSTKQFTLPDCSSYIEFSFTHQSWNSLFLPQIIYYSALTLCAFNRQGGGHSHKRST